jgi:hypothetical protein
MKIRLGAELVLVFVLSLVAMGYSTFQLVGVPSVLAQGDPIDPEGKKCCTYQVDCWDLGDFHCERIDPPCSAQKPHICVQDGVIGG